MLTGSQDLHLVGYTDLIIGNREKYILGVYLFLDFSYPYFSLRMFNAVEFGK